MPSPLHRHPANLHNCNETGAPLSSRKRVAARQQCPGARSYDRRPVADRPVDNTSLGRLRALYEWLTGATPPPRPSPGFASDSVTETLPLRIGHYAIARKLGEGGMGVVYAARDERLHRTVAVKTMSALASDDTARRRFWREA